MGEFRAIGKDDHVQDDAARVNTAELQRLNFPKVICQTLLVAAPVILIFAAAWMSSSCLTWAIIRAVMFFGGLVLLYMQALWIDRMGHRDVMPVQAGFFTRLIFAVAIGMFWIFVWKLVTLRSYVFLWGVLLIPAGAYFIRWWLKRRQESLAGKVMNWLGLISYYLIASFQLLQSAGMILLALAVMVRVGIKLSCGYRPPPLRPAGKDAAAAPSSSLSVLHLSDLHFMDDGSKTGLEGENRNRETASFLAAIAPQVAQADLVAVTGDITDTGFSKEWLAADAGLAPLAPVAAEGRLAMVPGNHDINVFMTYDKQSTDGPTDSVKIKLGLLSLGAFASRNVRLVRYLAFWDKWCGDKLRLQIKGKETSARSYLASQAHMLNAYADNAEAAKGLENTGRVRSIYEQTFPSVLTLPARRVVVYNMDSNAQTWHPALNGMGYFGLAQLRRLRKLVQHHPKDHAAIFLMHHHLLPGFSPAKKRSVFEFGQELTLITLDSVLFKRILNRLPNPAVILHGHTHYGAAYEDDKHLVFCAPSTGFGEAATKVFHSTAVRHTFSVGPQGELSWTGSETVVPACEPAAADQSPRSISPAATIAAGTS